MSMSYRGVLLCQRDVLVCEDVAGVHLAVMLLPPLHV